MELLLAFVRTLIGVAPEAVTAVRQSINELRSLSDEQRQKLLGALPDDRHESIESKWDAELDRLP